MSLGKKFLLAKDMSFKALGEKLLSGFHIQGSEHYEKTKHTSFISSGNNHKETDTEILVPPYK